ncbi:hypothetical protein FPV16_23215 [Methylobacterium sp. W2]|uniref:hypothetical protein n=1 Tax=Methylobacterium sp. W2 TaxID=2598107 RepID=UPI001D0C413C|nr:hypothetical protein [Methylobacterium sp. W2]MCC0809074.1 hypothetical protein [Methylobacterium sp. W2]
MEQGEIAHSTVMPEGQDVEHSTTDHAALDAAATKLLTGRGTDASTELSGGADPVFDLIAEHRAAWAAWEPFMVAQSNILLSDPSYAAAAEAERVPSARERSTFDALIDARPTTFAGILALTQYLAEAISKVSVDVEEDDGQIALRNIGEALRGLGQIQPSPVSDPIFALIEEGRRLLAISDAAFAIHVPNGSNTPPEVEEAVTDALHNLVDHCRGVLLQTVPQTASGCQELARFAVEYFEHQDVPIDDDQQAVTSLIARSPFLAGGGASLRGQSILGQASHSPETAPADLADACDWAVKHVAWMNATCPSERWDDARLGAEADKSDEVWRRADLTGILDRAD